MRPFIHITNSGFKEICVALFIIILFGISIHYKNEKEDLKRNYPTCADYGLKEGSTVISVMHKKVHGKVQAKYIKITCY